MLVLLVTKKNRGTDGRVVGVEMYFGPVQGA